MSEVKRGWLTKQGRVIKNWKRRFFVLKDGALAYYETENDLVPKGQLNLFGAAVVYVEPPKVEKQNCVEVSTPSRSIFIAADSRDEIKEWALAIQRASIVASGGTIVLSSYRITAAAADAADEKKPTAAAAGVAATAAAATAAAAGAAGAAPAAGGASDGKDAPPGLQRSNSIDVLAEEAKEKEQKAAKVQFTNEELRQNAQTLSAAFTANAVAFEAERQARHAARKASQKWNTEEIKLRKTMKGHTKPVNCVAQGWNRVASGGEDCSVKVWSAEGKILITSLDGHQGPVKSVAVTDRYVISGSDDGTIKIWNDGTQQCIKTLKTSTGFAPDALAVTHDGKTLVSGSDSVLQVWDLESKKCIADVWDQHKGKIVTLALAGQYLFSGSADHTINVWDMTTATVIHTLKDDKNWIFCTAVSPDREKLFSGSEELTSWDISGLKKGKVKKYSSVPKPHESPSVQCMAVTDDERYLVTASIDGFIRIWELEVKNSSKPLASFENKTKFIFGVTTWKRSIFTADRDGGIKVWE